jgi:hypothetical protein
MAPVATQVQEKTAALAEELTRIVMKVAAKMSKEEREERLAKLNERLSVGSGSMRA